jgi:hypothetical protein
MLLVRGERVPLASCVMLTAVVMTGCIRMRNCYEGTMIGAAGTILLVFDKNAAKRREHNLYARPESTKIMSKWKKDELLVCNDFITNLTKNESVE